MGEGHPFPPRRTWKYTQHKPFYGVYETNRRAVYLMQQRIRKEPFLATFDGADPNSNTAERQISTTALQALYMMNDEFVHNEARKLAERVMAVSAERPKQIDQAYRLAFARSATPAEQKLCDQFLRDTRAELAKSGTKPEELDTAALSSLMRVLFSSNEFVFVD
ncbi:MAG TPA: DUF1553 domain-containing protein, partial [Armatimonadota bacterium]|nr:DUF1553 domain-containing protein [Armatimonadota bacterium]